MEVIAGSAAIVVVVVAVVVDEGVEYSTAEEKEDIVELFSVVASGTIVLMVLELDAAGSSSLCSGCEFGGGEFLFVFVQQHTIARPIVSCVMVMVVLMVGRERVKVVDG